MVFYQFSDNSGKHIKVTAAFRTFALGNRFIARYQNLGEIRQFNYDVYGQFSRNFWEWANCKPNEIKSGDKQLDLFKYIMSQFREVK